MEQTTVSRKFEGFVVSRGPRSAWGKDELSAERRLASLEAHAPAKPAPVKPPVDELETGDDYGIR